MTTLTPSFIAQFKQNRAHQFETFTPSNCWVLLPDGRRVREPAGSGGGAAPGFHALAAFKAAKRHFHFMDRMRADTKAHKKRSRAAKRGWKTRRARG